MLNKSEITSLESYLAQIARELRDLPSQARADELREIESHLRAMIEARGDVAAVLAQFGKPRKVGRDLRRAWERKQPEAWWWTLLAPIVGLGFNVLTSFIFGSIALFVSQTFLADFSNTTSGIVFMGCAIFLFFAAQLFYTGAIVGTLSPKRGKRTVLLSAAAFVIAILLSQNAAETSNLIEIAMIFGATTIELIPLLIGVRLGARREQQQRQFARFVGL